MSLCHVSLCRVLSSWCSYLYDPPDFSGTNFIWLKDDIPLKAFISSYDFTQQSLLREGDHKLTETSAYSAYNNYEKVTNRTIFCNHAEVEDYIIIHNPNRPINLQSSLSENQYVTLSFITRTGDTGAKSGLNWGQRKNRNQGSYFPLTVAVNLQIPPQGHKRHLRFP